MKTIFVNLVLAMAVVSSAGLALRAEDRDAGVSPAVPGATEKLQPAVASLADENTTERVRVVLAAVANDATTGGKFENLIAHFAKPDRARIGVFKHEGMNELDRAIARFRLDFAARYHQDFALKPDDFRDAVVYAGKDDRSVRVQLPELLFDLKPAAAGVAVADAAYPTGFTKTTGGVVLNLVREGRATSEWRLDIPDSTTADQLKANLIQRIQDFDEAQANWPDDAGAANRAAAYRIFQALMDSSVAPQI